MSESTTPKPITMMATTATMVMMAMMAMITMTTMMAKMMIKSTRRSAVEPRSQKEEQKCVLAKMST